MKRIIVIKFLSFLCVLILLVSSCASVKGAWDRTKKENTADSYKNFLSYYSDSEYAVEAKKKFSEKENEEWEKATHLNKFKAYNKFISYYPESERKQDISMRTKNLLYSIIASQEGKGSVNPTKIIKKNTFVMDDKEEINHYIKVAQVCQGECSVNIYSSDIRLKFSLEVFEDPTDPLIFNAEKAGERTSLIYISGTGILALKKINGTKDVWTFNLP